MNQGGEPGQDDYGLPSVDIEIPDDARELDRDVQAYHREQRALRRQLRSRRWLRSPLSRYGTIRPMVAGFLVLALLSGLLLVVFSASQFFTRPPVPARTASAGTAGQPRRSSGPAVSTSAPRGTASGPAGSGATAPSGAAPAASVRAASARLPDADIAVAGHSVPLRSLTRAIIALISPGCRCQTALRQLVMQAVDAQVTVYLVGAARVQPQLAAVAGTVQGGVALTATDASNALATTYQPSGLTVLLVDSRGSVRMAAALQPGFRLQRQLSLLNKRR